MRLSCGHCSCQKLQELPHPMVLCLMRASVQLYESPCGSCSKATAHSIIRAMSWHFRHLEGTVEAKPSAGSRESLKKPWVPPQKHDSCFPVLIIKLKDRFFSFWALLVSHPAVHAGQKTHPQLQSRMHFTRSSHTVGERNSLPKPSFFALACTLWKPLIAAASLFSSRSILLTYAPMQRH